MCFSPSPHDRLSSTTQSYGSLVNCEKWMRICLYKVKITFPRSTASQSKTYNNKNDHLQPKLTSHTIWLLLRFAYANFDHFLCVSRRLLRVEFKWSEVLWSYICVTQSYLIPTWWVHHESTEISTVSLSFLKFFLKFFLLTVTLILNWSPAQLRLASHGCRSKEILDI